MDTITIGVDPGLDGAISILIDHGPAYVYDLPIIEDGSLKWVDGARLTSIILDHPGRKWAFVERAQAMPKQGVSSSFNYGVGFGSVLSVIQALQIPLQLVGPSRWKKAMGLTKEKRASMSKARMLFPHADLSLVKHHGRAEALLLAHWSASHLTRASYVASGPHQAAA